MCSGERTRTGTEYDLEEVESLSTSTAGTNRADDAPDEAPVIDWAAAEREGVVSRSVESNSCPGAFLGGDAGGGSRRVESNSCTCLDGDIGGAKYSETKLASFGDFGDDGLDFGTEYGLIDSVIMGPPGTGSVLEIS